MRGLARFSSATLLVTGVTMLETLVVLPAVPPAQMGIWQALLLAESYLSVLRFGVLNGLGRELPYALGAGDVESATTMAETALAYAIGYAALGGSAMLAAMAWFRGDESWTWGLVAMSVVFAATAYSSYLEVTFRGDQQFASLSKVKVWEAIVRVGTLPIVFAFGFRGLCIKAVIVAVAVGSALHRIRPLPVQPSFKLQTLTKLLKTGIPLAGSNLMLTVAMGFERLVLLSLGGVSAAGLYAPVSGVASAVAVLPNSVSVFAYPTLAQTLGRMGTASALRRPVLRLIATGAATGLVPVVVGWFLLPFVFESLFPTYLPALGAARIALIGGFFLSFRTALVTMGTLKLWGRLYSILAIFAMARYVLPLTLAAQFGPLCGVSLGATASSIILAVLSMAGAILATRR